MRARTLVSVEDHSALSVYSWHLHSQGYASRTVPRSNGAKVLMHRQILGLADSSAECDHVNRDKLDNRRENLRVCTRAENAQNMPARSDSSSGVRGVYWHADTQKWMARVYVAGRSHYLGLFPSVAEASKVAAACRAQHMPFSEEAAAA